MPITQFLNGENFDPETKRILGVAFEVVCIGLRTGDRDDDVKRAIAQKIIDLGKSGERNADLICEQVLKELRVKQATDGFERSEEARTIADELSNPESKRTMLRIVGPCG